MHGSDLYADCAAIITADDFTFGYCRRMWEAVATICDRGEEPDPVLVADEIDKAHAGALTGIGGAAAVMELHGEAIIPNAVMHARIVADRSRRRRLIRHMGGWLTDLSDVGVEVESTLARIDKTLKGDTADRAGIEFLPYSELKQLGEPSWEAVGLVPRGITVVFGTDGAGKSLLVLSLACAMASGGGQMVGGFRVAAGPVAWIAAEGQDGIEKRVNAWVQHHGKEPEGLWVHGAPVDLHSDRDVADLSRKIGRIGARLLVVDTLGRNFGSEDENNTAAMTSFVNSLDRIRTANDCSIIVVHHSGWDESRIRGNAKLKRDADCVIQMKDSGGFREISCQKLKDAPWFSTWRVRMVPVGESVVLEEVWAG